MGEGQGWGSLCFSLCKRFSRDTLGEDRVHVEHTIDSSARYGGRGTLRFNLASRATASIASQSRATRWTLALA